MKRIIPLLLILVLSLSLYGCGSKAITAAEAQTIAMNDMGVSAADVQDAHTHVLTEGGKPSYSIHITVGDAEYEYVISADGEILSSVLLD